MIQRGLIIFSIFDRAGGHTIADEKARPIDLNSVRGTLQNFCTGFPLAEQLRMEINTLNTIEDLPEFASKMQNEGK